MFSFSYFHRKLGIEHHCTAFWATAFSSPCWCCQACFDSFLQDGWWWCFLGVPSEQGECRYHQSDARDFHSCVGWILFENHGFYLWFHWRAAYQKGLRFGSSYIASHLRHCPLCPETRDCPRYILPFARGDVNQGRVSTLSHFMFYFRLVEIGLLGLRSSCWQTKPDDKEGLFGYKFCSLDRSSDVLHLGRRGLGTECVLEGGKFCAVGVWFTSISKTTSCLWSTLTEVPQEPDLRLTKCHCHSIAAHFVAFDLEELKVQWDSLRPWRFCERSFEASSVGDRYRVEWRAANGLECSPAKWPDLSDLSHRLVMRFLEASKHVSCLDRSRDWVTKMIFFQALNWDPWSDFEVAWSGSEGLLMGQVLSIKVSIVWPTVFCLISCSWLQFLLSVLKLFQKNSKQTAEAEPAELASFRIERWDQVMNRPTPGSHVSKPTRNFWSSVRSGGSWRDDGELSVVVRRLCFTRWKPWTDFATPWQFSKAKGKEYLTKRIQMWTQ